VAGRDADALARDLRAVRPRLQRRARDQRRPRDHQRGHPPLRQAPHPMALSVHFTHPLRSFDASVQLTVPDGTTTALVGPSGAGKTTVRRVAAGLLRPRTGVVALGDRTWLDTDKGIDVSPERRRVGYLFQEYALFPHLDVLANVRFGAGPNTHVDQRLRGVKSLHLRRAPI